MELGTGVAVASSVGARDDVAATVDVAVGNTAGEGSDAVLVMTSGWSVGAAGGVEVQATETPTTTTRANSTRLKPFEWITAILSSRSTPSNISAKVLEVRNDVLHDSSILQRRPQQKRGEAIPLGTRYGSGSILM